MNDEEKDFEDKALSMLVNQRLLLVCLGFLFMFLCYLVWQQSDDIKELSEKFDKGMISQSKRSGELETFHGRQIANDRQKIDRLESTLEELRKEVNK